MICPVRMDEWQRWRKVCSGVVVMVSGTVAMNPCGGMKGVCMHVTSSTLKSVMELRKSVLKVLWKVNHTSRVKQGHPYISAH